MSDPKELVRKPKAKATTPSRKAMDKAINEAVEQALSMERYAIGKTKFTCSLCGKLVDVSKRSARAEMYKSTDPNNKIGYVTICRECIENIVYQVNPADPNQERHNPTPESIKMALEYMDKPWIETLFERGISESLNKKSDRKKEDAWTCYIKNIQSLPQYQNMRWKDGDCSLPSTRTHIETELNKEIYENYELNKKSVIHTLGYDPFISAPEERKPLMYSQLIAYMDESTTQDQFKLSACIEIVQSHMQSSILNEKINAKIILSGDISTLINNKKSLDANALALAKDNGISIKNSDKNTKGSNTFTGQLKDIKNKNLRSIEMNSFDINTCKGMKQVSDISAESIISKIRLDENDYTDIIANQRKMVSDANQKCEAAEEEARILRRENDDLKAFLIQKGLIDSESKVIL